MHRFDIFQTRHNNCLNQKNKHQHFKMHIKTKTWYRTETKVLSLCVKMLMKTLAYEGAEKKENFFHTLLSVVQSLLSAAAMHIFGILVVFLSLSTGKRRFMLTTFSFLCRELFVLAAFHFLYRECFFYSLL